MLPMPGQGRGRVLAGEVREPRGDRGGGRGGWGRGRGELRGDPQLHPAAAGVGAQWEAVEAAGVCQPRHQARRDEPAGAARPEAAAEAGQGDGHLPGQNILELKTNSHEV